MSTQFPSCQLCGIAPASCKSHIIPKQYYKRVRGDAKHLYELTVGEEIEKDTSQNGIWEQGLLCLDCDNKIGDLDRYSYAVLPEELEQQKIKQLSSDISLYQIGDVNIEKFIKFLASLLWRASRSKHEMFKFVNVGSYEAYFADTIKGVNQYVHGRIDCIFIHLKPPRYEKIIITPSCTRFHGVNVVNFYLFPWKLVIKLDKRPFDSMFNGLTLKGGAKCHAYMLKSYGTGELAMLADLQRKIKSYHTPR